MNLSVGRVVHYVSHGTPPQPDGTQAFGKECRAAIVTEVALDGETAGLCVLNPTGQFFNRGVEPHLHGEIPAAGGTTNLCEGLDHPGGTWHWPARV